uniref:Uncharacterized protein n=2 Tax=Cacopsylla melanoneura TaxID=428564 RepID=A0A8D8X7R9_9HEMI
MFFPNIKLSQAELRTDEEFRTMSDEEFHLASTPLNDLMGFNFIHNVPLDYMHLVCLGVMKKLLMLWQKSKMKYHLNPQHIENISGRLTSLRLYTPAEFSRKPRSLAFYKLWKATEYRQFLMYVGYYSIENIVHQNVLINFTTLMCAIRIFSKAHQDEISYGHDLIEYFLKTFRILYTEDNMSYNVHNLLHLANDVTTHGALDNFSAFKFENYLFKLKKLVKKTSQPLQQIQNRFVEGFQEQIEDPKPCGIVESSHHCNGPLPEMMSPDTAQYSRAYINNLLLNTLSKGNNCFLLDNENIVIVENIFVRRNCTKIFAKQFTVVDNVFNKPCDSKSVGIYLLKCAAEHLEEYSFSQLKRKLYLLPRTGSNDASFMGVEMIHVV